MKKSDHNFSIPARQPPVAILIILTKFFRNLLRQLWPLLLVIVLNRGSKIELYIGLFALILSLFSGIMSVISYFRYTYCIIDRELIIEKGILSRKKINVPFDRIQTINFEQSVIHQFLSVVSVKFDTAGSSKSEVVIDALYRDQAEALRNFVLNQTGSDKRDSEIKEEVDILLFSLGPSDLLKIGISQNHIETVGILLAFALGMLENLGEILNFDWTAYISEALNLGLSNLAALVLLLPVFLLGAIVISLFRTVIRFYDLRFWKSSAGFRMMSGLLNRREQSIKLPKIQYLKWSTNPLRRIFGIFEAQIYQASSTEVGRKGSVRVPGLYENQLDSIKSECYNQELIDNHFEVPIDSRYASRLWLYIGVLPGALLAILSIYGQLLYLNLSILWVVLIWLLSRWYVRKWKFTMNKEAIYLESGLFTRRHLVFELFKIQALRIYRTPYQVRNGLANLIIYTAAGRLTIPYIEMSYAQQLFDFYLCVVESSTKNWM